MPTKRTETGKAKRGPGRPKGSTNRRTVYEAGEVPNCCPHCKETRANVIKTSQIGIVIRRVRMCEGCGNEFSTRKVQEKTG